MPTIKFTDDWDDSNAILKFSAKWCGPCKAIQPFYETLSDKHSKIHFYEVDIDTQEELTEKYNVRNIPVFVRIKKGKEVGRCGNSRDQLNDLVTK